MTTAVTAAATAAITASPRIPRPREPVKSPNLYRPARRIGGVASRNAGESSGHAHAVSADAGDQRRALRHPDDARFTELERVESATALGVEAFARGESTDLRPPPEQLSTEQDEPVEDQEERRGQRLGQRGTDRVLEQHAQDPDGNRRRDDQPCKPLGGRLDSALTQRDEERADDSHPVAPEVDQQPHRAADVQHHHERQPRGFRLRLPGDDVVPPEQVGEDHRVAQARDRE